MIFMVKTVSDDAISSIRNMTTGVQNAFNQSLPSLPWLDPTSRASVQFKLENVIQVIGHPNVVDRYSDVSTNPTTYFQNVLNLEIHLMKWRHTISTSPFNRSNFEFPPLVVNAFYSPDTNTINFPAGILESPMFSASWPKLFQYSRLGYIVGHENTHGFDSQGSYYNAYGQPGDILDNSTRANYNSLSQCIVDFYSNYVVYDNVTINGKDTLGENIADIGGLKNSYRAYEDYVAQNGKEFADGALIQGLTTDQVFFLFFGQTLCSAQNQAYLEKQVKYDPHSPTKFRVNGALSQFDVFASTFQCNASSPMNPKTRCDLW